MILMANGDLRLIVQRETETSFDELVSMPVRAEQIARVLPGLLAETLGAELVAVTSVTPDARPADVDATGAADGDERPRRRRRTKAEIAADELAAQQAASAAPAAEPAESAPATSSEPAPAAAAPTAAAPASDAPAARYDPFA